LGTNQASNAEISNFSQGQVIPQIDPGEIGPAFLPDGIQTANLFHWAGMAGAKIVEKGHFWMETN
jgi:hypothetical protein